ncbi:MAG: hypothetical protein PHU04_03970 [Candidatus Peribacteraceae bacterium]|nr:hypothetical protein [Candidatus Peribacteraceae bacterium]
MDSSLAYAKTAVFAGITMLGMLLSAQQAVAANTPAEDERAGKVTIGLVSNQQEVMPGNAVLYTIEVRNHDRRTQDDVQVSFQFDPEVLQIVDKLPRNGTMVNDRTVLWTIDAVYANQTWSTSLLIRMRPEVNFGAVTDVTARVSGPQIQVQNSTISSTATIGAAVFPPTGGRFDLLFLCLSALGGLLLLLLQTRKPATVAA